MLLHIPEVLTRDEVRALRQRLDAADWVDGRATVGVQGAAVKHNRQLAEDSPVARELGAIVAAALARSPLFFAAALPLQSTSPLFNRYESGEHYGLHVDGAVRQAGHGRPLRTDVSSTLFLGDPDTYDGGELVVVDTYGEHAVKLPAGDLVVYPSTSLHRVEPVTRGARVCAFLWTQSLVRDDARRALLFEMDQHLQQLRARLGHDPAVVGLSGTYHNLLRQWAGT